MAMQLPVINCAAIGSKLTTRIRQTLEFCYNMVDFLWNTYNRHWTAPSEGLECACVCVWVGGGWGKLKDVDFIRRWKFKGSHI